MAAAAFVKEEVDVIFGVALRCLSIHIHHSVFYSHQYQYFKKCSDTETAICPVLCPVCESQQRDKPLAKMRKLLKITDGTTKGIMVIFVPVITLYRYL